jgi:hypothetical protein
MIVWLASYPRSGNTFLRALIARAFRTNTLSVYSEDRKTVCELALTQSGAESSSSVTAAQIDELRADSNIHFVKTHELAATLPSYDYCVYLVRDGRDAT